MTGSSQPRILRHHGRSAPQVGFAEHGQRARLLGASLETLTVEAAQSPMQFSNDLRITGRISTECQLEERSSDRDCNPVDHWAQIYTGEVGEVASQFLGNPLTMRTVQLHDSGRPVLVEPQVTKPGMPSEEVHVADESRIHHLFPALTAGNIPRRGDRRAHLRDIPLGDRRNDLVEIGKMVVNRAGGNVCGCCNGPDRDLTAMRTVFIQQLPGCCDHPVTTTPTASLRWIGKCRRRQ
ncbi:hypothetical protein HMPREF1211_06092 [Streptomyces sp. HGB0020]|nr:hypothetical protein HMPREF1211_06092 [Streptomyces sp. HGB0020]